MRKDGTEESVPTAPIQTNSSQSETGTIRAFLEALLRGEEPPASGRELLPVMRGVFAAIRSSRTGGVEETGN